jgi:hypothetical protein
VLRTASAAHRHCLASLARGKPLFSRVLAFSKLYVDFRQAPLVAPPNWRSQLHYAVPRRPLAYCQMPGIIYGQIVPLELQYIPSPRRRRPEGRSEYSCVPPRQTGAVITVRSTRGRRLSVGGLSRSPQGEQQWKHNVSICPLAVCIVLDA